MTAKHIALIGMMGAGKSAVGRALAQISGRAFVDSDEEIERAAAVSIPEIFARDGEAFFRARESEVIARLLDGPPVVLATGGGAWMTPAVRDALSKRAVTVWLDPPFDTLWTRVRGRATRPLLQTADPRGTLERLLAERAPVYALADLRFEGDAMMTVEASAAALARALAKYEEQFR